MAGVKSGTSVEAKDSPTEEEIHSRVSPRYLEAIFYMHAEGEIVRASHLADWLGVTLPTASVMLRRMLAAGLVSFSPSKEVSLTDRGRGAASKIVRRHRIAERWLTDVLGFDWLKADQEASKLEHAFSDEVAERVFDLLGRPSTCPHGNPIPGVAAARRRERPLADLETGDASRICRVSEVAEHQTPELLQFLSESGLLLGAQVQSLKKSLGAQTITVQVDHNEVTMSLEAANKVWVEVP